MRRLPAAPCPPPPPSHHDRGSCQARGAAPHAAPSSCGPQRSAAARVASTSARRPALTRAWVVARRRCCSSCQSAASPVRARLDRLAAMDAPRRASWSRALWMPSSARVPCVAVLLFGCVWGWGGEPASHGCNALRFGLSKWRLAAGPSYLLSRSKF